MQRKDLSNEVCPVARSLEQVGEWWSMLILRDALAGLTRFDEFEKSLSIAPNMLSRRLAAMVESNILEKRKYCDRPPRYEYVPTQRGRDFQPVLWALLAWGNKHCTEAGKGIHIVNIKTGAVADPVLVDRKSGKLLSDQEYHLVCEAKAAQAAKERVEMINARRTASTADASSASAPAPKTSVPKKKATPTAKKASAAPKRPAAKRS
ncbi:winged helix-turn-helix transcriptional regulator [Lacipirellula parvula]|uniref:Transcriptional regulator n=1 Tax=Lacipirellula parvula TaxID=2650471 RepID=A0A5K7XMW8_9BACT|nr:helix-turn-helix domain-containing protein [Lacipirellula parvula]BBO36053.1 transcriptional regulator [Lacipirellula parvula]